MGNAMLRKLGAEWLGSLLLAATVIGSGIMAERLANGNVALALLANTGATVAVLTMLILLLAPVSGAHFNPAVSFVCALRRQLTLREFVCYVAVQVIGCVLGALLAHAMFDLPLWQLASHARHGGAQWLAEIVATFGLILAAFGGRPLRDTAWMVSLWIGAAYWFTSSTSFANPAITVARALTDTFSGIRPSDAPGFIAAQFAGALLALVAIRLLGISTAPTSAEA